MLAAALDIVAGDSAKRLTITPQRATLRGTFNEDGAVRRLEGDTERLGDSLTATLRDGLKVPKWYALDEPSGYPNAEPESLSESRVGGLIRSAFENGLGELLHVLPADPVEVGATWLVQYAATLLGIPSQVTGTATLERVEEGVAHITATLSLGPDDPSGFTGTSVCRIVLHLNTSPFTQTTTFTLTSGGPGTDVPMRSTLSTTFTAKVTRR